MLRTGSALLVLLAAALLAGAEGASTTAAALAKGWQGVPGRNLLLNPDFELDGNGWYYEYSWPKNTEGFRTTARSRPVEIAAGEGMDGGAALKLVNGQVRSWCFPVAPGRSYSLSLYARPIPGAASGTCGAIVSDPEWQTTLFTKAPGLAGERWLRQKWGFTWNKPSQQGRAFLIITGTDILIDRVQLEEGKVTAYEAPAMIGLAADRRPYFVRGRDALALRLRVAPGTACTGAAAALAVARDAWGREAWRHQAQVALDRVQDLPLPLPADHRLGTFHVEMTLTCDGRTAGIGAGRYAVVDPPRLEAVEPGRLGLFGVCHEAFVWPAWWNQEAAGILRDLGVRTVRFFGQSAKDLPSPLPQDLVDDWRARLEPLRAAGIEPIPCVGLFPGSDHAEGSPGMPGDETIASYGARLREYATALKGSIRYLEGLNEPNLWRVHSGPDKGKPTMQPQKQLRFQRAAFAAVKAADPGISFIGGVVCRPDMNWIRPWLAQGATASMDAFSFHAYRNHPDDPDTAKDLAMLRAALDAAGFRGPLINGEQYFGVNLFQERNGWEEAKRGYFVPHHDELRAAGRAVRNYIHHAAAGGVPFFPFAIEGTLFRPGPGREMFIVDLFAAYNAATRFLVGAGRGAPVEMGEAVRCFLFPAAEGGPLAAVWTPLPGLAGSLRLETGCAAFDLMGNAIPDAARAQGLRLATDPVWLRFPAGSDAAAIRAALANAEIRGLGSPVRVDLAMTGPATLTARVVSCSNRPVDGVVRLLELPAGWSMASTAAAFAGLAPGRTATLAFTGQAMPFEDLATCRIAYAAEVGDQALRQQASIRPAIVRRLDAIAADGDLGEWPASAWRDLGEPHRSKDFNPKQPHQGPADLSARLAMAWNPEGLALALVVTDDVHRPSDSERMGWEGDAVQLYVDCRNDAVAGAAPRTDDDVACTIRLGPDGKVTAWVDKGSEGNFKGANNKAEGFHDVDVQVAAVRAGTTTTYEIVLPRARCLPEARLMAGSTIGFSLLINDNDGAGRKTGLTLSPRGSEPYGNPADYADLALAP